MPVPPPDAAEPPGGAPLVLFVHGQPGVGRDFDAVAELLAPDHRLLAPDRPGYGNHPAPAADLEANADALAELVRATQAGPAVVVGHSYGGGIAVLLAARHPTLVRGLVLAASIGGPASLTGADRVLALPVMGEVLSAAGLYALGRVLPRLRRQVAGHDTTALAWLTTSLPDERYHALAGARARRVRRSFVYEQRVLVRQLPLVEAALAAVDVPTVVVTGSWDVVVPPEQAVALAGAIAGSELVVVARTGHFLPRDRPRELAAAVRRVERRARR